MGILDTIRDIGGAVLNFAGGVASIVGDLFLTGLFFAVSFFDFIFTLFGFKFSKYIGVNVVILRLPDGNLTIPTATVQTLLDSLSELYKREVNIAIMGRSIIEEEETSPDNVLKVNTSFGSFFTEVFGSSGRWFRNHSIGNSFWDITLFIVADVNGARGRTFGFLSNYAIISGSVSGPGPGDNTFGHEIGHMCNLLLHHGDAQNVMHSPSPSGVANFTRLQEALIRSSRHTRYF